ncbi:hypothetical protein E1286_43875 [Nonomuraea terrae]|uniref:Uncharacterized protein n=1 Tax=Nonomuraea terrae TaxID=2530383 RepID=A0A4R4XMK6_9ACTN|nr:hypothetical protein [Nonomuraea terrae]TDD32194.1 hypothetical protein E1286_43875 [Nonomuraea terrae]
MSGDHWAAARDARMRKRATRKKQVEDLLQVGVTDTAEIGRHLRVTDRTVQRYLRELQGNVDRRVILYPEIKPLVLAHLRKYPHLRITGCMLARALQIPFRDRVENALLSLERDGLVRREIGTRKEGDLRPSMKLILWSLAEQGQPDGQ